MNSLPPPLGDGALRFWRLDAQAHAPTWDSGEGAYLGGGRWNPRGVRAVYCSLDPATTVLEIAVHKGFANLDMVPRIETNARIANPDTVRIVRPEDIPNPHWLHSGRPSAGQQAFGADLLASSPFVLVPSVVSGSSWNLIFSPPLAAGAYDDVVQRRFALDPRLHPAP